MTSYAIDAPHNRSAADPAQPLDRLLAGLYLALAGAGLSFLAAVAALALA
jgi:hypothetical protein